MPDDIKFNPGEFGKKLKKLFENFEMEDDLVDSDLEEDEEDAYEKLENAAEDIQDAVNMIRAAETLEGDDVIDYETHQDIEADASSELSAAADELNSALEDFDEKEKEENEKLGDSKEEEESEEEESEEEEKSEEVVENQNLGSFNKYMS